MLMNYLQDVMHCCLVTAKQQGKASITAMKQQLRRIINFFLGGKTILQEWGRLWRGAEFVL
jgi:hypothetical protein